MIFSTQIHRHFFNTCIHYLFILFYDEVFVGNQLLPSIQNLSNYLLLLIIRTELETCICNVIVWHAAVMQSLCYV